MVVGITSALLVAGLLGLAFSSTRGLAIAAIAALTFIYPVVAILVVAGLGVAIYIKVIRINK